MELKEALLARRSVRRFTDKAVSESEIEELLHAAMSGPSACNMTPWEFYAVTNSETLAALRTVTPYTKIVSPLAVIVCGNLKRALPGAHAAFWVQDCSAATENILLRAVDLGLGSVWCGIHPNREPERRVSEILGLSEDVIPLNIIFIGHPETTPPPRDQYNATFCHLIK